MFWPQVCEGFLLEIFGDWWVKVINIKIYDCMVTFFFYFDMSFHWFKVAVFLSLLFVLPRIDLLNLSISIFAWLISLVFGFSVKFGLWSFRDLKHSFCSFTRILFAIVLSFSWFVCWCFCLLFCIWLWLNLSAISCTLLFLAYTDL